MEKEDSFLEIAKEVIDVLNELKVEKTHVIGMSLGTLVTQTIVDNYPKCVRSLILGGAIIRLNLRTKFLIWIGHATKKLSLIYCLIRFSLILLCQENNMKNQGSPLLTKQKECVKKNSASSFP